MGNGWSNQSTDSITLPTGALNGARIVLDGTTDAIYIYDANNVLIGVWAGSAGTDPATGVSYQAGFTVINDPVNGSVSIQSNNTPFVSPVLHLTSGQLLQGDTQMETVNLGSGVERYGLSGPINALDALAVQALMYMISSNNGGTGAAFQLSIINNQAPFYTFVDANTSGTTFRGTLASLKPGASSLGLPVVESWTTPTLGAAWTTSGISHPLRYRFEGMNGGVVRLDGGAQAAGAGPWPAGSVLFTLPAGYRPVAGKRSYITRSAVAPALNAGTVAVLNTGDVTIDTALTAAGQQVFFDGVTAPLD